MQWPTEIQTGRQTYVRTSPRTDERTNRLTSGQMVNLTKQNDIHFSVTETETGLTKREIETQKPK